MDGRNEKQHVMRNRIHTLFVSAGILLAILLTAAPASVLAFTGARSVNGVGNHALYFAAIEAQSAETPGIVQICGGVFD